MHDSKPVHITEMLQNYPPENTWMAHVSVLTHSLSLSLLQNAEVSVFEVNIRFVGGLLSAYYLSGKEVSNI